MEVLLNKYGNIISDQGSGEQIYNEIKNNLQNNTNCIIDLQDVKSMATYNAKQIFGKLYLELGAEVFFQKIEIKNASQDLRLIIRLGIQSAIEDDTNYSN
jgi:STAS-like domain of unknown function (DUF4325)